MTDNTYRELESLFNQVMALPERERHDFLSNLAQTSPRLAQRLSSLLNADAQEDNSLELALENAATELMGDTAPPALIGKSVGVWRIVDTIGSGGMGVVFRAQRDDAAFEQSVALKVMSQRVFDPAAIRRFSTERQILANLDHPGIARLIDGGATSDGLPYLVMEYVEGTRIDLYCDAQNLSLKPLLKLFRKVCDAVDFAHRNLVVHRDIKPANILISSEGQPKLLDFGIAKLLNPEGNEVSTGVGQRAMTPEYASPEQVRGQSITVASDVYALGVLLYRLVTGHSPYGDQTTTPAELERAVLEHMPIRPSKLRHRLAGDIDTIILKCLSKEPARRYASVRELTDDIQRFENNEAVLARGDSVGYRMGKFLVRRAPWVIAGSAALIVVAASSAYYTLGITRERDRAQLAADQATQVSEFLINIFGSASPTNSKGEIPNALDLLDAGAQSIEELSDQPVVQAALLNVMGRSYTNLGQFEQSLPLLERSLAMKREHSPDDLLGQAEAHHALSENYRYLNRNDESVENIRQVLALNQQVYGTRHKEVAFLHGALAHALNAGGRLEEALAAVEEGLEIRRAVAPELDADLVANLGTRSIILDNMGRHQEALAMYEQLVIQSDELIGKLAPDSISRLVNAGMGSRRLWQHEKALAYLTEASSRAESVWEPGADEPAFIEILKGDVAQSLGRFDEAWAFHQRAGEIIALNSQSIPIYATTHHQGMGDWYREMGRFVEAETSFAEGMALAKEAGNFYMQNYNALELGSVKAALGKFAEAETLLTGAIADDRSSRTVRMQAKQHLAVTLSLQERWQEAEELFQEELALQRKAFGGSSPAMLPILTTAAAHYRRAGDLEQSLQLATQACEIGQASMPERNWNVALACAEKAFTLAESGSAEEAKALAKEAHQDLVITFGEEHFQVKRVAVLLL